GVFHCFTETMQVAEAALALGFHISFSGILTFRNARELHEVARVVPMERCLIETDSPYLAPVPHRGKVNQPAWVAHVAARLAALLLAQPAIRVDAVGPSDETPLMMAAIKGNLDWVQRLVARGAAVNRKGWTPLHYAASSPEVDVVAWLLERGAEVNALSPNGT